MITLKLYGDESSDETSSRVFAVAVVVGTEEEWAQPVRAWLRRNRGLEFKASACETQFSKSADPDKHTDSLKLYADMTGILAESHLVGLSVALDLQSQQELLPGIPADIGYYKCFGDLLVNAAQMARDFNNDLDEPDDVKLEFTFDSRLQSDGTAGTIYKVFTTLPEWNGSTIFDTQVTFDAGPNPRLEIADLLAREAMKELDRKVTASSRPSGSPLRHLTLLESSSGSNVTVPFASYGGTRSNQSKRERILRITRNG